MNVHIFVKIIYNTRETTRHKHFNYAKMDFNFRGINIPPNSAIKKAFSLPTLGGPLISFNLISGLRRESKHSSLVYNLQSNVNTMRKSVVYI